MINTQNVLNHFIIYNHVKGSQTSHFHLLNKKKECSECLKDITIHNCIKYFDFDLYHK